MVLSSEKGLHGLESKVESQKSKERAKADLELDWRLISMQSFADYLKISKKQLAS
jgi:hypothetical protein